MAGAAIALAGFSALPTYGEEAMSDADDCIADDGDAKTTTPGEPATRGVPIGTKIVLGIMVAAMAFCILAKPLPHLSRPSPESVVRDFLEAVRTKQLGRAARIANPIYPRYAFLAATDGMVRPEAVAGNWRVKAVKEASDEYGTTVKATLSAGTGWSATGTFVLADVPLHPDKWRIVNPVVDLWITTPGVVGAVHVNGVDVASRRASRLSVLPGLYRIRPSAARVFKETTLSLLAVTTRTKRTVTPSIAEQGEEYLRGLVRHRLENCVDAATDRSADESSECPFEFFYPRNEDAVPESYEWKILRYPTIEIRVEDFAILVRTRGGTVRGSVTDDNGDTTTRTMPMRQLVLVVGPDDDKPTTMVVTRAVVSG